MSERSQVQANIEYYLQEIFSALDEYDTEIAVDELSKVNLMAEFLTQGGS